MPAAGDKLGRAAQPPGLFEDTQCFAQVLFLFGRLPVGRRLCLGLSEDQEKLIAIALDLGLLRVRSGSYRAWAEPSPSSGTP